MRIAHNTVSVDIEVPTAIYAYAISQRDDFVNSLVQSDAIPSPIYLCSRFISHIARDVISDARDELAQLIWKYVERSRGDTDIHTLAAAQLEKPPDRLELLGSYFSASCSAQHFRQPPTPALLRAQREGKAQVHGIFGGQGLTKRYFDEIRDVYTAYIPLVNSLVTAINDILVSLARDVRVREQFGYGLDILSWINDADACPPTEYLLSAPVSFPLIGLLQLVYIKGICMSIGLAPGEFTSVFKSLAGHSQGIVVAVTVATATDWSEFSEYSIKAVIILFWIGARSQQAFYRKVARSTANRNGFNQEESSSPMLSVSNIRRYELEGVIDRVNENLPSEEHLSISLANTDTHFVISGPEQLLLALVQTLKDSSAPDEFSQARLPFSQRKPSPSIRFIPITIPCHGGWLDEALPLIDRDLEPVRISVNALRVPVNQLSDRSSLNTSVSINDNLVPTLVRLVTSKPVLWNETTFSGATHIVDFGPGSISGVGSLTNSNLVGAGVRVIIAGRLDKSRASDLGSLLELTSPHGRDLVWAQDWALRYKHSVVQTRSGPMLATKLSRLLGLPPIFVAGMTPTTTHPEFVAAIMRAGFHVEFAAGGYHNATSLRRALYQLREIMPAGRSITINIIYVNPKAVAWQIPFIRELRASGFPLTGLTIGGGVPSVGVATEYIATLGLEHISFKPSSTSSILQVVEIARQSPSFPVILQWTGGRGGGHHSAEDFHTPILETYAAIRACSNITLVAGSGFGSSESSAPYLTGLWSHTHNKRSPMPFDGILLGSRVMTCAEAHTSSGAKAAIANARGVSDQEWEGTYQRPTGGVLSVKSEMGEPMHVIATRGAQVWAELDRTVFSLPKSKRGAFLIESRMYIIPRLNADSHRPWFGKKADGRISELSEMTYAEVIRRFVELTYRGSWIDGSYSNILLDLLRRVEDRFTDNSVSVVEENDCYHRPMTAITNFLQAYPVSERSRFCYEDIHLFLQVCKRPKQKPVPFIPVLDDDFEVWFKKDSLWQSERIQGVMDHDADRALILHGPVSAKFTNTVDEPVGDVLNNMNAGILRQFAFNNDQGGISQLSKEEFLLPEYLIAVDEESLYNASTSQRDLTVLRDPWVKALFGCHFIVRDDRDLITNPFKMLLSTMKMHVLHRDNNASSLITLSSQLPDSNEVQHLEASRLDDRIQVKLFAHVNSSSDPASLTLEFEYRPEASYAPIWEGGKGERDHAIWAMYRQLWGLAIEPAAATAPRDPLSPVLSKNIENAFVIERSHVTDFAQSTGYNPIGTHSDVPLDYAFAIAWRGISEALLQDPTLGDFLNLVHLSNKIEINRRSKMLTIGNILRTNTCITSLTTGTAGTVVEITCKIQRCTSFELVATVISRFLFRGKSRILPTCFTSIAELPYRLRLESASDIARLGSQSWFFLDDGHTLDGLNLTKLTLEFHLKTFKTSNTVESTGKVFVAGEAGDLAQIGTVQHTSEKPHINAVLQYLSRRGYIVDTHRLHSLPTARQAYSGTMKIPSSNERYSRASGDYNPIHTSEVFAQLAGLPGTITHGMYCSAAVRQVVEEHAAGGGPSRIRSYDVSFIGMVLPGSLLDIDLRHTGMQDGVAFFEIEVVNAETRSRVLQGSAFIAQPSTTIVFTGQGSQIKGMGMDLYASSSIARNVWKRADSYFISQFGVSILGIVNQNPKSIKVHFGGNRGRQLRRNYMSMQYEIPVESPDGKRKAVPMFPTIREDSMSFTHFSPNGLLFSTEFAQPALAIMEIAAFNDMQAANVVDSESYFAGHSLGEYVALACKTNFMTFENLLYVFFCRGLTMQSAVERDGGGNSNFCMIAVDPSRIKEGFQEAHLQSIINEIRRQAGFFIEIVNFNVRDKQYVCAGDLSGLDLLQDICDTLRARPSYANLTEQFETLVNERLSANQRTASSEIQLKRGAATVPLFGIDVPFHSSYLRPRMEAFRRVLLENLDPERLKPSILQNRYIPNLTGLPFSISRNYIEDVWRLTGSDRLRDVLENWEGWMDRVEREKRAL